MDEHFQSSIRGQKTTILRTDPYCLFRTDSVLGEHGIAEDNRAARLEFSRRLETRRLAVSEDEASDQQLRSGWRLGGETFLARLLDRLDRKLTAHHLAMERTDTAEAKAERIIQASLRNIGWTEEDLRMRKKCAPEKVEIARYLRAQTTLSLKRVAERLNMGTWTNTSNLLYEDRRQRS